MDLPLHARTPVGWPFPWKGLLTGGLFLAMVILPLGEVFGLLILMGGGLLFGPFVMVGILIAGEARGALVGVCLLGAMILFGMVQKTVGIVRAQDRQTRALLMNRLVAAVLITIALILGALRFAAIWRH